MPRRSRNAGANLQPTFGDSDTEESSGEFYSPEEMENATNYGLEFTGRIVNPYRPPTNRGAQTVSINKQPTARKKTSKTPPQHQRTPAAQHQPTPAALVTTRSSVQERQYGAGRRKQRMPLQFQLMQSTHFLVPRLPFGRLIREILINTGHGTGVNRITGSALEALQESAEMYLVQQLQDAYTLTLHRGQVTLQVKDMEILRFLRGYI